MKNRFTEDETLDSLEEEIVPALPERCRESALALIEALRDMTEEEADELSEAVRDWLDDLSKHQAEARRHEEMLRSDKKGLA